MSLLARFIVNGIALAVITYFGWFHIHADGWTPIAIGAIILGLANAIIRPILIVISCPLEVLSLGLFTLIINGAIFYFGLKYIPGFYVPGYWAAFWGAIVMTVISWIFSLVFRGPERRRQPSHGSP